MTAWSRRRENLRDSLPGRALLTLASWAYGTAVALRRALYAAKILPRRALPARVICVGNLTAGGTGKTPAVLLAAETLRRKGRKVAVLSRGYGRTAPKTEVIALTDGASADWRRCGDEPWMLHQSLKGSGVPVLSAPDRVKAGARAVSDYGAEVVILDDGFQHFRLRRDLDVVLVNARDPFGGRRLLPRGDLREPPSALRRAGVVVLTHADRVDAAALSALRAEISALNPAAPIVEASHAPDRVFDARAEKNLPLSRLRGAAVVAVSGIGDPSSFESSLKSLGADVAQAWRYPDHHPYAEGEMKSIDDLRGGRAVVTTFKDFSRFPERWRELLGGDLLVLGIALEILKGREQWEESLDRAAAR